jgi:hypothetical protein
MTTNDSSRNHPPAPVAKGPYEKPTFRYEKVFVTTALSCGKIAGTSMNCTNNPKIS